MDCLLGRGNSLLGQEPSDGLPRLTFTPRFKDEIEVRLQFALKRFAAVHTYSGGVNRSHNSTVVSRCQRFMGV
jgi:hypothetical protein